MTAYARHAVARQVHQYIATTKASAMTNGVVHTIAGRRRPLPELVKGNKAYVVDDPCLVG